ncbi:DEAD-box ATP-dependent RNA helicase [Cymbomonas tetramitiformis]|uniref:DEAD-box ATP-dependent RNA helicase n=1 Tax=Cymbomonas tetramitiformis TaxID=36881 RepID=A0AAE0GEF7_9CHLO|nr:DEAD-box ATP-dependent RNA helicase [Cymbomonas tetramitiformis]
MSETPKRKRKDSVTEDPSKEERAESGNGSFSLFSKTAKAKQKKNEHYRKDTDRVLPGDAENSLSEPGTGTDTTCAAVEVRLAHGVSLSELEEASFKDLGLSDWLCANLKTLGIKKPSPVQANCIPPILRGEDVLGTAETGSGKTASFALPILQRLSEDPYGVFALAITPTRELASQIVDQFEALGAGMTLKVQTIIGGMDMLQQSRLLQRRPHIVVATPGRLRAHLESDPNVKKAMASLRFLVLDEADRLLDSTFEEELFSLLSQLPSKRQTLLFSATLTKNLTQLQELSMKSAFHYLAYDGLRTVRESKLQQEYMFMPSKVKEVYLVYLLGQLAEWGVRSAIIFVASCRTCQMVSAILNELEIVHAALHAAKTQPQRSTALQRFRSGIAPVLVATDVASRGLDIPTVDLVINLDLPMVAKEYVHRVGRTARAGRKGRAVSFVTEYDVEQVQRIETVIEQQLQECKLKEKEVLSGMTKVLNAKRVASMQLAETGGFDEKLKAQQALKRQRKAGKKT